MGRAPCCEKVGLKKGRWTAEEDDTLTKYIQANGEGSWRSLPKNAGLLRCGKSCRLRWINYLRNDLKRGNISTQEEDVIIKLHASLGNKWSLIAGQLPGRTDNEIKNYWNSHLSRKIDTFRRPHSEPLPIIMNLGTSAAKKKGGRTSRAAMKKNKFGYTGTASKIGKSSPEMVKENNIGVVPLPSKPTSEKETLPSAIISWQEQEEKERRILGMPSSYQEIMGEGMLGSSEERENIVVLCNGGQEEREARNLMLCCPTTTNDQESSEPLGPHDEGLVNDLLSFHDINMCCSDQLQNPNRALLSSYEEGEKNNNTIISDVDQGMSESGVMSCLSKFATSEDLESGNLSSNGESSGGEHWLSCSPTTSYLEDGRIDWEWEGLAHENLWKNELDQEHEQKQAQEEMLSWLWDSSDNIINGEGETQNLVGEIDSEKQEALVTWLLS